MNITKVQIHLFNRKEQPLVKAWADIILDNEFIVRGLAIREHATEHYCFVTMPSKTRVINNEDVRTDIAHPINEQCRRYIEEKVLDEYEQVLTNNKEW